MCCVAGYIAAVWMTQPLPSSTAAVFSKHVIKRMLLVSTRSFAVSRLVSLSGIGPPISLSSSKYQWICAPLASRSRNVLRCSLSMFLCACSWSDTVTTLVTSAPVLAKRIDRWDPILKIDFSTDRTVFDMLFLWLVHWFTHSMLDEQATVVRLNHGGHRWCGRGMQCAVIRAESHWSLRLPLELIAEHPRTQHKLSGQNVTSHFMFSMISLQSSSSYRRVRCSASRLWPRTFSLLVARLHGSIFYLIESRHVIETFNGLTSPRRFQILWKGWDVTTVLDINWLTQELPEPVLP